LALVRFLVSCKSLLISADLFAPDAVVTCFAALMIRAPRLDLS
jgi:hypothetical protein